MWFGDRLKILREEKSWNQQQLASLLSLSRATISKYETTNEIDIISTLINMSELFDVPVDYILGLTDCRERYPAAKPVNEIEIIKEGLEDLSGDDRKVVAEYIAALKKRSVKGSDD